MTKISISDLCQKPQKDLVTRCFEGSNMLNYSGGCLLEERWLGRRLAFLNKPCITALRVSAAPMLPRGHPLLMLHMSSREVLFLGRVYSTQMVFSYLRL